MRPILSDCFKFNVKKKRGTASHKTRMHCAIAAGKNCLTLKDRDDRTIAADKKGYSKQQFSKLN